jgi:hypothetical protein
MRLMRQRDSDISTWPTLESGAQDQQELRQLRETTLEELPAYQMSGQSLDDWVRERWGSPDLLNLGLDDLLSERNDGISRRVVALMANDANAPAEVFREYRLMKRRWMRRMGGEWDVVDGRETFVPEADEMPSSREIPCRRSGGESLARTVQSTRGILFAPSATSSSGTTIFTPDTDASEAGRLSHYSIPREDTTDRTSINEAETVKERKRSMCEDWLSVTYP